MIQKMKKGIKNVPIEKLLVFAGCLLIGFWYVYFYSVSTSPRYPDYFGHDSAQFQTLGMAWSKGYMPYGDLFDHKGPYIFLVNLIGYHVGFMAMQTINMAFTLFFIYLIGEYISEKWYVGIASSLLSVFVLFMPYCDGNYTEEYCMPFLFASFYLAIKSIREEKYKIPNVILYGITAGICLMTRATNFLPVAVCILVIIVLLVMKKDYKNIFISGLVFIGSMLVVVAPFAIYFAAKGLFGEFINGSFLYNFKYLTNSTPWVLEKNSLETINNFVLCYFCVFLMVFPITLAETARERVLYILLPAFELALFCYGIFFYHYPMIALFQVALFVAYTYKGIIKKKTRIFTMLAFVIVMCYFSRFELYAFLYTPIEYVEEYGTYEIKDYEVLANEVEGDFVGFGSERLKDIYLRTDRVPCSRFFSIQDWHASFDEETKQEIRADYLSGKVKNVIVEVEQYYTIRDILLEKYDLVDEQGNCKLYTLRE